MNLRRYADHGRMSASAFDETTTPEVATTSPRCLRSAATGDAAAVAEQTRAIGDDPAEAPRTHASSRTRCSARTTAKPRCCAICAV